MSINRTVADLSERVSAIERRLDAISRSPLPGAGDKLDQIIAILTRLESGPGTLSDRGPKPLMTVAEFAVSLDVSEATIRKYAANGMPYIQPSGPHGRTFVDSVKAHAWLAEKEKERRSVTSYRPRYKKQVV